MKAALTLQDGTVWHARVFGAPIPTSGEVVFNTAMTGYPESLTDPSYSGQILVTTYPLLGNYGVPHEAALSTVDDTPFESDRIHPKAIICQDYSEYASHRISDRVLSDWLAAQGVIGLTGIDTRALTQHLRSHGSMPGRITVEDSQEVPEFYDPNCENLIEKVSTKEVLTFGPETGKRVVLVDCGTKNNIIRCLTRRGMNVTLVPWDYDFNSLDYDGLFISNGPGNPEMAGATIANLRRALNEARTPICGICMGNQLLSLAAGAKTYKLKFGHRSHNQPVREVGTDRCFMTSQNHGFAVDASTLGDDWEQLFVNLNDGSNEGIRHKTLPIFSAQFHPEASSGPKDTEFLFDRFVEMVTNA